MTEDLLEEQSEVLAKLGTSAEGTHLRARMQSACLLSDMESFKVRQADIHTSVCVSFVFVFLLCTSLSSLHYAFKREVNNVMLRG